MTDATAPMPDLQDQVIAWDVVDSLLDDIAATTRLFSVLVKSTAGAMAEGAAPDLAAARQALTGGQAVQLRYLYQGTEWWDTLIPCGDQVRIVRVQQIG
jgi:hypothetical protein